MLYKTPKIVYNDFITKETEMKERVSLKNEIWQLLKFALIGTFNVLLDIGVYTACFKFLKLPTYQSQLMGVTIGLATSYFLNRRFTFHSDKPFFSTEVFKFALVSLFCAPASSATLHIFDEDPGLGPWWSKWIVTALFGFINYILCKTIVYRPLRERKMIRRLSGKVYSFNAKVKQKRMLQVGVIAAVGIAADLLMYLYLTSVGLDSYKAQPLCVVGGLVVTYLATLKFIPYRMEHAAGYCCIAVICTMISSPTMYIFDVRFGLHALLAKIPATVCIAAFVFFLSRMIVFRDVFDGTNE